MYQHVCRNNSLVIHDNLTCQFRSVAYDTFIAYDTVVGDVYSFHQKIPAAHYGPVLCSSSPVDSNILADGVVVAYLRSRLLSHKFQVLGNSAYYCAGKYGVTFADACSVQDCHAIHQLVVVSYHDIPVNVAERTDLAVITYLCLGMNVC